MTYAHQKSTQEMKQQLVGHAPHFHCWISIARTFPTFIKLFKSHTCVSKSFFVNTQTPCLELSDLIFSTNCHIILRQMNTVYIYLKNCQPRHHFGPRQCFKLSPHFVQLFALKILLTATCQPTKSYKTNVTFETC